MPAKRKAVSAIAKVGKIAIEEDVAEKMLEEVVAPAGKVMKKPAAAASKKAAKVAAPCEEVEEHDEEEEEMEVEAEKEEVNEEEAAAKREEEQALARKKELKAMYMDDLKQLASNAGLEMGKKENMIDALLEHEAKIRAEIKAKEARMRAVVVQKKAELEGQSAPELKDLCASVGIKGVLSKQERIAQLLAQWQDNDGVDKALAKMAFDQRKDDLFSKDQAAAAVTHRANQLNPSHVNYWSSRGIQPTPMQTVYHGTSSENAAGIMKQGFKASSDGLLGSGTYVTTDKSKAQAFAGSHGTVVKAVANFGRVGTVDARAAREHQYSDRSWQAHYDTAFVPKGEGVARPEHCVKDPQRVVPVEKLPSG